MTVGNRNSSSVVKSTHHAPETFSVSTNPLIMEFRRRKFRNAVQELRALQHIMDEGDLTRAEWSWAYRRWKVLQQRVYGRDAWYTVRKGRRGRPRESERDEIRFRKCVDAILEEAAQE